MFQLHRRGVMVLEAALLKDQTPSPNDTEAPDGTARPVERGSGPGATSSAVHRAGIYLLRTKGAEIADALTARECSKLVRTNQTR